MLRRVGRICEGSCRGSSSGHLTRRVRTVLRVGLTGGTGAGKTTVAARLRDLGALVVDADGLAREVVAPGSRGLEAVVDEFGAGVLSGDGALDRPALAALVFADPARRRALEQITHPLIAARTAQILDAAPADAVVVHDVPLLVEKRMGAGYHLVLVVDAPPEVRVQRLVRSRGMSPDDAWARVRAQASDDERRAAADVLLDNSGEPDAVLGAVDRLWHARLVPFEENVRLRHPAARSLAGKVVPYDPTWPTQAARLVERVARAVGQPADSVEHVGPTAVPGQAAEDVLDLRLTMPASSAAELVGDALGEAGFAPVPEAERDDDPGGAGDTRLLHSCDPGRAANLHVRVG